MAYNTPSRFREKTGSVLSTYLDEVDDDNSFRTTEPCVDTGFSSFNTTQTTPTSVATTTTTCATNPATNPLPKRRTLPHRYTVLLVILLLLIVCVTAAWYYPSADLFVNASIFMILPVAMLVASQHRQSTKQPTVTHHPFKTLAPPCMSEQALVQIGMITDVAKQALRLIKHAELQVRGFELSEHLPPIARIEQSATFHTSTFQCKPLREDLYVVLSQTNELLLRLVDGGAITNISKNIDQHKMDNNNDHLYIEALNQLFSQTKELFHDVQEEASGCETTVATATATATAPTIKPILDALQRLYVVLNNSYSGEINLSNIQKAEHKTMNEDQQQHLVQQKRMLCVNRTSAPFNVAVNTLRTSFNGISVSLFRIMQDTQDLLQASLLRQEEKQGNGCKNTNTNTMPWHELTNRIAKEKAAWMKDYNTKLIQWECIEQNMIKIAQSVGGIELLEQDCQTPEQENHVPSSLSTIATPQKLSQVNTTSLTEPSQHVSVFEAVAVKVPRKTMHQLRKEEALAAATTILVPPRIHLNTELSTVLTNRKKLPELVRKLDRSGWSEKGNKNDIGTAQVGAVGEQGQKDEKNMEEHVVPDPSRNSFRNEGGSNMMAELMRSLQPASKTQFNN